MSKRLPSSPLNCFWNFGSRLIVCCLMADALEGLAVVSRGHRKFLNGVGVICKARLHCGSDAKGLMQR
jgi:hypothetical protein